MVAREVEGESFSESHSRCLRVFSTSSHSFCGRKCEVTAPCSVLHPLSLVSSSQSDSLSLAYLCICVDIAFHHCSHPCEVEPSLRTLPLVVASIVLLCSVHFIPSCRIPPQPHWIPPLLHLLPPSSLPLYPLPLAPSIIFRSPSSAPSLPPPPSSVPSPSNTKPVRTAVSSRAPAGSTKSSPPAKRSEFSTNRGRGRGSEESGRTHQPTPPRPPS